MSTTHSFELLLRHEATVSPAEKSSGSVLCQRVSLLVLSNGCVRVHEDGGWDEYNRARGNSIIRLRSHRMR